MDFFKPGLESVLFYQDKNIYYLGKLPYILKINLFQWKLAESNRLMPE